VGRAESRQGPSRDREGDRGKLARFLTWRRQWGSDPDFLKAQIANCKEQGVIPPEDFYPPDVFEGAELYLDALDALQGERSLSIGGMGGMIQGRIPFRAIERFAERYGIDDLDEFDRLRRIVERLDADEVKHINEKANQK
jgi:hypothetical protein